MRYHRHRRPRPRRLSSAARTILLLGWLAVTLWLIELGLPVEWGVAAFFLGPVAAIAVPLLVRRISSRPTRLKQRGSIDWGLIAMATSVAIAGFFAVLWWPWPSPAPQAQPALMMIASARASTEPMFSCRVVSVHDGDTLRCSDGTRVRLHAVAARENDETCSEGHPCPTASAASARIALVRLAENRTLNCRRTGRNYNRVTAICDNDEGVEINCAMVRSGTTLVWERFHRQQPICRT